MKMPMEGSGWSRRAARRLPLFWCSIAVTFGVACQEAPDRDTDPSTERVGAADAPQLQLAPASDSLGHHFEGIAAVRELDGGRILVSDERAAQLFVADFGSDSVRALGRQGRGPGEYRQAGRVWPAGGDTTLHKEPYAPRLLVLAGSDVVATQGGGDSIVRRLGSHPILGVDTLGRVLVALWHHDAQGRTVGSDSLHLVRMHWRTGVTDTIARVQSIQGWKEAAGGVPAAGPQARATGGASARGSDWGKYSIAIQAPDRAAVLPSGWIAIARAAPYRVDWCSPAGACTAGPVLQADNPPLTDEYKVLHLRRAAATFSWPPVDQIDQTVDWPDAIPPFTMPPARIDGSPILSAPRDRVLIERMDNGGSVNRRYDVISREAGLVGWIEIPPAERVVGFGARHVYVSRTSPEGWQQLRRHPWTF